MNIYRNITWRHDLAVYSRCSEVWDPSVVTLMTWMAGLCVAFKLYSHVILQKYCLSPFHMPTLTTYTVKRKKIPFRTHAKVWPRSWDSENMPTFDIRSSKGPVFTAFYGRVHFNFLPIFYLLSIPATLFILQLTHNQCGSLAYWSLSADNTVISMYLFLGHDQFFPMY